MRFPKILAGNRFSYEKVLDDIKETNLLGRHIGFSETLCGITCRRLSCSYFITRETGDSPVCMLYGDNPTDGGFISDNTLNVWMPTGDRNIFEKRFSILN